MLPIGELEELLEVRGISGEYEDSFATVGGLIMTHLGRVPSERDRVDVGTLRFEVMDMDGYRVDKVLITRMAAPASEDHLLK
jgi:putative hemolysin